MTMMWDEVTVKKVFINNELVWINTILVVEGQHRKMATTIMATSSSSTTGGGRSGVVGAGVGMRSGGTSSTRPTAANSVAARTQRVLSQRAAKKLLRDFPPPPPAPRWTARKRVDFSFRKKHSDRAHAILEDPANERIEIEICFDFDFEDICIWFIWREKWKECPRRCIFHFSKECPWVTEYLS